MGRIPAKGFPFCSIQTGSGPPTLANYIRVILIYFPGGRGKRPEFGTNYTPPLMQRLGMGGAVPSLSLYENFVLCTGTSL